MHVTKTTHYGFIRTPDVRSCFEVLKRLQNSATTYSLDLNVCTARYVARFMRTMSFSNVFIPSTGFAPWRRSENWSKSIWAPQRTTVRMIWVSCTAQPRTVMPILPKVSPDASDQVQIRPPVRNAHIAILTDFTANPLRAMQDRASDPVFAAMLIISALCGALFTGVRVGGSRKNTHMLTSETEVSMRDFSNKNKADVGPSVGNSKSSEDISWLNSRCVSPLFFAVYSHSSLLTF